MNASIRKMELSDLPAVTEIDRMSFSLPWPESSFRFEVSENTASQCLVAETEDHRIAAMIVSWIIEDEMHIATIATHEQYRRQGIGTLLLRSAMADAQRRGARRAFLEVRASNLGAQEMYGKLGFKEAGKRPRYYRDNGEDAVLMALERMELQ